MTRAEGGAMDFVGKNFVYRTTSFAELVRGVGRQQGSGCQGSEAAGARC